MTTASTENSGEHNPWQRQRHQCNRCRLRYDIQFGNPGLRSSRLQPTSNLVEFCTRLRRFLLSLRLGFDLRRFGARWNAACNWGAPVVRLGQCTFEPDSAGWANFKAPTEIRERLVLRQRVLVQRGSNMENGWKSAVRWLFSEGKPAALAHPQ
jgi:hypothetical protein